LLNLLKPSDTQTLPSPRANIKKLNKIKTPSDLFHYPKVDATLVYTIQKVINIKVNAIFYGKLK
jgi:hypothetical protein